MSPAKRRGGPAPTAEHQRWRWHNDPAYRAGRMLSARIYKIKTQIRRHEKEIKRLESELLELSR